MASDGEKALDYLFCQGTFADRNPDSAPHWMQNNGPQEMVKRVISLIKTMGGSVVNVKPSRLDLCVDVLPPASEWYPELAVSHIVARADDVEIRSQSRRLSSFAYGKGKKWNKVAGVRES